MTQEQVFAFLISASLGALIGLERQWEEQQAGRPLSAKAGLRTFVLWALLGITSAYVDKTYAPGFYPYGFLGMALLLLGHITFSPPNGTRLGLTTLASALMTFLLGSLTLWGETRLSLVLAVCIILLLAGKHTIHHWSRRFTQEDVRSALQFLAITGVILPMAPDHNYGPFEAFNPFKIWLMVVLVVGLGFFGYVAIRLFGPKTGLGTMGILGGLTSSTVTTLAFSRQSRTRPELTRGFALGIVLACTVMLARVALLVGAVNIEVLRELWPALAIMCLPGLLYGGWCCFGNPEQTGDGQRPHFTNPLDLKVALQFAALYVAVNFLSRAALAQFGGSAIHVVSFISGLTDMDAIALSLSQMSNTTQLPTKIAAAGIVIAAVSNTLLKAALALAFGSRIIKWPLILVFGTTIAAGLAAWFWRVFL